MREGQWRSSYALVFAGQGSQRSGMALPWRGHSAFARWQEADDTLGMAVSRLGVEADEAELRDPLRCQLALFVHQAVLAEAWTATIDDPPVILAGHSLGEYNALVAAGVLGFGDALRLVYARAAATAAAAAATPGGMTACIGVPAADVTRCADIAGVHVCNDNAPGQLVVAGDHDGLKRFEALLSDGPGTVRPLAVGAAYHSPAMEMAVPRFMHALVQAPFRDARLPVIANVDAVAHTAADDWRRLLARQLVHAVRWRETVLAMESAGVIRQVELAATPVLTGLAKRITPTLDRDFVDTPESLERAVATMAGAA